MLLASDQENNFLSPLTSQKYDATWTELATSTYGFGTLNLPKTESFSQKFIII